MLSLRIKTYLPKLIHADQVGFVTDRFIGENIKYIEDLVEYSNRLKEKYILLSIDIEKAFDTLEWEFIFHALQKYNFGPNLISWIQTCYKHIYSTVINNGFSSGWFRIHRGVRQGCSLSCILFVLAIEIMAALIRKNESIAGVSINNCNRKLDRKFADDTTCILRNVASIRELFTTLTYFGKYSGQKLNMEKSILVWLGPWKQKTIPRGFNVTIETGSINMLGIYTGNDHDRNTRENFRKKLDSRKPDLTFGDLEA